MNLVIDSAETIINVHDTQGVCEARARLPAGDNDDRVAALDEAARLSELDAELNATFNVLHPVGLNGVWKSEIMCELSRQLANEVVAYLGK